MKKCDFRNCDVMVEDYEEYCNKHETFVDDVKEALNIIEEEKEERERNRED